MYKANARYHFQDAARTAARTAATVLAFYPGLRSRDWSCEVSSIEAKHPGYEPLVKDQPGAHGVYAVGSQTRSWHRSRLHKERCCA
jgi:hypothetical protein